MTAIDPRELSKQVEAALAEPTVPPGLAALVRMMLMVMLSMHQQLEMLLSAQLHGQRSGRVRELGAQDVARAQSGPARPRKPKASLNGLSVPVETVEQGVPVGVQPKLSVDGDKPT